MNIEMKGIDKSFGSNQVLKNAGFFLKDGEIHALIGSTAVDNAVKLIGGEGIAPAIPVEVTLITAENAG